MRLAINQGCEEIESVAMIGSMTYSPVIRLRGEGRILTPEV